MHPKRIGESIWIAKQNALFASNNATTDSDELKYLQRQVQSQVLADTAGQTRLQHHTSAWDMTVT